MLKRLVVAIIALTFSTTVLALLQNMAILDGGDNAMPNGHLNFVPIGEGPADRVEQEVQNERKAAIIPVDTAGMEGEYIMQSIDADGKVVRETKVYIWDGHIVDLDDTLTGEINRASIRSSLSMGLASSISSTISSGDYTPYVVIGGIVVGGILLLSDDNESDPVETSGSTNTPAPAPGQTTSERSGRFQSCNFISGDATLSNLFNVLAGVFVLRIAQTIALLGTNGNLDLSGAANGNNLNLSGNVFIGGGIGTIPASAQGAFDNNTIQLRFILNGPFGQAIKDCLGIFDT